MDKVPCDGCLTYTMCKNRLVNRIDRYMSQKSPFRPVFIWAIMVQVIQTIHCNELHMFMIKYGNKHHDVNELLEELERNMSKKICNIFNINYDAFKPL